VTPVEIIARRIAPFWLAPEKTKGDPAADAATAMGQRYRKADGTSLTQFNTGALIVREESVLALTECQPLRPDPAIVIGPTKSSRNAVIEDIRRHGPPLLAVVFKKAAMDVGAWVCSTADEVVLNGPAGPEEVAEMEDVAMLRALPGTPRAWRKAIALYAAARADLARAPELYAEVDKLASATAQTSSTVLDILHRLHRAPYLAFALAEPSGGTP
jgi:hypothetical protein